MSITSGVIWLAYSKYAAIVSPAQAHGVLCVCGWTCVCAYMCAEWEQGHSWGLGFLSEHHLQASLYLIGKPTLARTATVFQDCVMISPFFPLLFYDYCIWHWLS